jgi:hypothetical protein
MNDEALCDAIQHLTGGTMYHMREVGKNTHQQGWIDLLDRKFIAKEKPENLVEGIKAILDDYIVSIIPLVNSFSAIA